MPAPETAKYANFERLPAAEQAHILQACIEEFAQNGYTLASTNAIVKRAGIPKGTLFYFFGSKKDLYLYVIDHAVARFAAEFKQISASLEAGQPSDLFERLLHRGAARMQFVVQEPLLYQVFYNAFINTPDEILTEMQTRFASYAQTSGGRLLDGLDTSKFREDIQPEKAVELVTLALEGLFNRYLPAFKRLPPAESLKLVEVITAEARLYFEMLKKGLYKDEYKD
jgi:TetR/AcrR family transcriptional regulator